MHIDPKLDFDQIFKVQHILYVCAQTESSDDTRKPWVSQSFYGQGTLVVTKPAHNWIPPCSDEC